MVISCKDAPIIYLLKVNLRNYYAKLLQKIILCINSSRLEIESIQQITHQPSSLLTSKISVFELHSDFQLSER